MIRKQVTLAGLQKILGALPKHMQQSNKDMLKYYMEKIFIRHFQFGNESAYGYKRLDARYKKRKILKWGRQPTLVASGTLRESARSMYKIHRIHNKYRIVLTIPEYGRYVKEIRDFTLVNKRDMKDIKRWWKKDMLKRRKRFVTKVR